MTSKQLTTENKKIAEQWCALIDGVTDDDVRTIDAIIQTAALLRQNDAAKKDLTVGAK